MLHVDTAVMIDATSTEIAECVRAIRALWDNTVDGSGCERAAREASANLMSESGLLYVPPEAIQMLTEAIEVGYATAGRSVDGTD